MSIDSYFPSRQAVCEFFSHRLHRLDTSPNRLLKIRVNPCHPWFLFALRIRKLTLLVSCAAAVMSPIYAQDAITKETITGLEKALEETREGSSEARQRLAVRRVIRDAEELVAANQNDKSRFLALEFLFRARQQLIALDKDTKHRDELLETCRELLKAPDDLAELRLEADLLLSQAELAKKGANNEARAQALRPFIERYIDTPVGAKVLRLAMVMALELGDNRVLTDLQEMIERRFAGDLEMIKFQRDKLGGQVIGAPFAGIFERSDGKIMRFPMDGLGRSTMLLFWSKNAEGEDLLKGIAAAALEKKDELAGRLEIVSINLDELPDAGESFIRSLGVDWKALRLPGGKKHPVYDAFARTDPRIVTMSPTGYTALIMTGAARKKEETASTPDYGRMLQSSLAREWTWPRYASQLASLMIGDFLVLDPDGGIDPTRPPELKALAKGGEVKPLTRGDKCVPEETLRAIQDCFVMPPLRYRLSHAEIHTNYAKAAELCRKAMADHPSASDLWIVRNRLIIALMGLWKTDSDLAPLEAAITEAKAAMTAGFPDGCDVIARFCITRGELRNAADTKDLLKRMVKDSGGDAAPGPAFAAASLLALDVADRTSFENFRTTILKGHTEYPMMWTYTAFLLDRHHDYWLFQVPFTAGWSYGKRQDYFLSKGDAEEAHRMLRTELQTDDGKTLRIPEDLEKEWTMIVFSQPGPWSSKRDDGLPESPERLLLELNKFAATRPAGDVKVMLATFGGDAAAIRAALLTGRYKMDCPVLTIPGGLKNPLVQRLGILSEDDKMNSVLIRKDGRITSALSGLVNPIGRGGSIHGNVISQDDEHAIAAALERGEIQAAKDKILALAPQYDPNALDAKGRKIPKPPAYSLSHLRARAQVYMALKEWDKALVDAEEVVQRQLGTDGGMSLRTDELDESERLRDTIKAKMAGR
jgi:tetratricopeptide (TPR) repeat protein